MTFLELLKELEARLGYHQIPLNAGATSLKNLFESIPLHHDFMRRLAQAIYSANRCRTLRDAVEREATFEAFAPLRLEALRGERTDVDLVRMIEELCVALDQIFGPVAPARARRKLSVPAQVIDLARFRRRRWLKSPA